MKGHTWKKIKANYCKRWVTQSTWAAGTFSSNSFISPHEENRKNCHPPPDFLLLWSNWAKWSWHSCQQVTVFEVCYVIPGKQGLEKRECSYTAGGKLHPKIKAKIQVGLNYDSVWLLGVWTKGQRIAGNVWRQIWYLAWESKGFLCSRYAQIL